MEKDYQIFLRQQLATDAVISFQEALLNYRYTTNLYFYRHRHYALFSRPLCHFNGRFHTGRIQGYNLLHREHSVLSWIRETTNRMQIFETKRFLWKRFANSGTVVRGRIVDKSQKNKEPKQHIDKKIKAINTRRCPIPFRA